MSDTFIGDEDSFSLTDAQRRYSELFGPPQFAAGPARNPYTPGGSGRIVAGDSEQDEIAREIADQADEDEAALWGAL